MNLEEVFKAEGHILAENVKAFKKINNWTQKTLYEISSIGEITIRNIEKNRSNPLFEVIIKLANTFKIETAELFNPTKPRVYNFINKPLPLEERIKKEKIALGNRLQQLIDHRKIDNLDISIIADIDYGNLSRYINGQENLKLFTIFKLASALQVKLVDVFDYKGQLPSQQQKSRPIW